MPYQVIALYKAKDGMADAVEGLLHKLAAASRKEDGNLSYAFYRSPEDGTQFAILEKYVDEAAFAAHRASGHFQEIGLGSIIPLLESREVEGFNG